jgi:hypothetical protein
MSFTTASAGFLVGLAADFGLEGLGLICVPYVTSTRPNPSIIRNPKSVPKALTPNNDIYETACASVALPVDEDSVSIAMFRMVIAQARNLIRQRDEIERTAHAMLAENRDYQLLRMIPGIGPINALTILAEAGDLRRFSHHRQFLKFCGLDLATRQSGTFRGRTMLSKYGNARLRRTFWMAAQVAARQRNNSFRDKLGRYTAGHADDADRRRKAMTALTAKMARVAHAVIKTGTEYRPFLERSDARWKDPSLQVP